MRVHTLPDALLLSMLQRGVFVDAERDFEAS